MFLMTLTVKKSIERFIKEVAKDKVKEFSIGKVIKKKGFDISFND